MRLTSYIADGRREKRENATDAEWGGLRRESRRLDCLDLSILFIEVRAALVKAAVNGSKCRLHLRFPHTRWQSSGCAAGGNSSLICIHGIAFSPFLGN